MARDSLILVQTCFAQRTHAQEMATALIAQGLAGCTQISGPTHSTYRWKGKLQHEKEYILSIKTVASHYPKLAAFIDKNHPYELPEIIATTISAVNDAYLDWVEEQCAK